MLFNPVFEIGWGNSQSDSFVPNILKMWVHASNQFSNPRVMEAKCRLILKLGGDSAFRETPKGLFEI